MNSYGDPSSARGRAQYPSANGDHGPADDAYQRPSWDDPGAARRSSDGDRGGWPANNGRAGGASARASVSGRGSAGRATPPGRDSGGGWAAPVSPASGSASVGSASPGRARVGGRAGVGSASVPEAPGSGGGYGAGRASAGRASVGTASVGGGGANGAAGRARVGRAAVPVSPAGPGGPDDPDGPGGRRGRRGGGALDPAAQKRAKKRKRVNMLIAAFAVFIMLAGGGVVAATYYSTNVPMPDQLPLPLATTIYAADGKNPIAKLGEEARQIVTIKQVPAYVQKAVASAEDRKFYEHDGVDYVGIARAAWNNFTGGSKQGASTITQQYARNAYENLQDDSYQRKAKEAILASKLNEKFSKDEIMQHYLNTIYFGRGAYGIEIAAQTYFRKPAAKLTVAEGAVLAAVIKQPQVDTSTGHKGFDPADNPEEAKARWEYVLNGMVEKKWLSPEERAKQTYPEVEKRKSANEAFGVKTPRGNVVNYVKVEMAERGLCTMGAPPPGKVDCSTALRDGGYKIKTTINWKMQAEAENAAQRKKGSPIYDERKNLMAALVSVEPKTGKVLAYYGGDDGSAYDYAGLNNIDGVVSGGHPPGSSFKVYTLAAAINEGISIDSIWDARPFTVKGTKIKVQNAGRDVTKSCDQACTLKESTIKSYNVPFYHVTEKIGADKVLSMARQAGVRTMWETKDIPPKWHDLTKEKPEDLAPDPFFNVVAYGQYPITVLDHANGLATLANGGVYNKAHFIELIEQQDPATGQWKKIGGAKADPKQRIPKDVADQVTSVLKNIPKVSNGNIEGREEAGKTGTWEYDKKDNAHAWMVGYTPQVATAVWVGSKDPKTPQIKTKGGDPIGGSGLPAEIWQQYMSDVLKGKEALSLPDSKEIGDKEAGNGKEKPTPPPVPPNPGGGNPGGGNPGDNPLCQGPNPPPLICGGGGPGGGGPGGGGPDTPPNPDDGDDGRAGGGG
ncbi:transglycosylase domain-containing protein [Plantactinospora sp. WMMB782]|uniref:transglycosylase domain-containing protein n=1 Tax=Plantactinospora sp. WMMB782 TaxID=3404121 RepID=UPI003B94FBA2